MNENKLKKLFEAARNEAPPLPPGNFESRVVREIQREPRSPHAASLFVEQLNTLVPRIALAAAAVVIACVVFEAVSDGPDVTESVAQISDQWLFAE